mgnify:CR=1 FL=1
MAIKRYLATKDNTITNAFKANLSTRGTGSNMGMSDVLEVFTIYGQASSASSEEAKALVEFSTNSIIDDRTAGTIPASGSVRFFLQLYNAKHAFTTPRELILSVVPISASWQEGRGLDMEEYSDLGASNWVARESGSTGETLWTTQGGDFHQAAYTPGSTLPIYSKKLETGTEDLEVDITALVEEWIEQENTLFAPTTRKNYGVGVFVTSSQATEQRSYYTKKFFARGTEFFFKRPVIEARWDSSRKDNAISFYQSSSLVPAADNLNTLYLYNNVRGQLKNIPNLKGGDKILLSVYESLSDTKTAISLPIGGDVAANGDFNVTGGLTSTTGIYSASFAYTGSATKIYPVWHSGSTQYHTGSAISVKSFSGGNFNPNPKYVTKITNLKPSYTRQENARFRLYTRQKDWNPTIYTKASSDISIEIVDDAYYKIVRSVDELEAIPYGTGSLNHTRLSYDASGSYFDLDIELLEAGYAYEVKFSYYVNGAYHEQAETFKFRVD